MVNFLDEEEEKLNAQASQVQQPNLREQLYSNLISKYGLDQRNKVVEENKNPGGFNWRALAGGIGTALQGKGAQGAADILDREKLERESNISQFDKQRDQAFKDYEFAGNVEKENKARQLESDRQNPNSERSKAAQQLLIQDFGFNPDLASKMSAEQIEARIPTVTAKLDREFKASEAQTDRDFRAGQSELDRKFKAGESALDRQLKDKELGIKSKVTNKTGVEGGLTEGQKKVDQDYAKQYNDFSAQGAANARMTIDQLKQFQQQLEKEGKEFFQSGGGRIGSMLPDTFRTDQSLIWKKDIPAKANLVLKKLFGGQLSDDERKSESATYYDDKLGPAENAKKLSEKIKQLEAGYTNEARKAKYFEENGTLKGFVAEDGTSASEKGAIVKKQFSPSRNKTRIVYADGSVEELNGQQ